MLLIKTDSGEFVSVHAFHTVLANAIEREGVNGQRLVVDANYAPDTTKAQRDEEEQIVHSLRFVSAA